MRTGSSPNASPTWRSIPALRSRGPRHGVDRQVAALQILLERHVGRCVHREALVAAAALSFRACERVFLLSPGVEEHREILSDRAEALGRHLLGCRADHHPVAVGDRQAEQLVAHRASHDVGFHRRAR
jgi:hypothetical protein